MNKLAIKGFSVRARRKLIEDISQKAYALGIKETGKFEDIEEFEGGFRVKSAVNQTIYPLSKKKDREKLIVEINRKGFEEVVEEVAYTWFNRIIAIRFMEINEYLPVKVRMLSSEVEGKMEPDVLTNIYDYIIELELDSEKVFSLKENHKDEELFKYVFVKECNNLGKLMPQVFEAIGDYSELLLPDQLLSSGSVIRDLVESIDEDDFKKQVEIIGWMYQYYISEKKDVIFAALKNNERITKENIPAATQLFTPKWIVKYMTENSLGRLWQESHPDEGLKQKWEYYIEPAEQVKEVEKKLKELKKPNLSPEEIKILDPAMGSGHILVYAFDVLYDIYLSRGYAERDIPNLILEKNLFGLDIDDRAAQLASFALLMKARSKNRRIFRTPIKLNLCSIKESNGFSKDALEYFVNPKGSQIEKVIQLNDAKYLIDVFNDAKEYGSIIKVKKIDFNTCHRRIDEILESFNLSVIEYSYKSEILEYIPRLLKQAEILRSDYDIVVTNPPYMGKNSLNSKLANYLTENYIRSKHDLFATFMDVCKDITKPNGLYSMINQHSWMFISSYKSLRKDVISNSIIQSMLHLGPRAFEEISGEVVQTTTFVIRNTPITNYKGTYFRLIDYKSTSEKETNFISQKNAETYYISENNNFLNIDGYPIAYWVDDNILRLFSDYETVGNVGEPKIGLQTGDNDKFLRYWFEVDYTKIGVELDQKDARDSHFKWFPLSKGGRYRKWYGNNEYVVDWEHDGSNIKNDKLDRLAKGLIEKKNSGCWNEEYYFREGLTWSKLSTNNFGVRYNSTGHIFETSAPTMFFKDKHIFGVMAFLNSKIVSELLKVINPTLSYQTGDVLKLPYVYKDEDSQEIEKYVKRNIEISKSEWDSYETSWEFNSVFPNGLKGTISCLINECILKRNKEFDELKFNEEKINEYFINIYSLQSEMSPQVDDVDITIKLTYEIQEVKSLISYFIGCAFGRYSLDENGLVYAGGKYVALKYSKFKPMNDNILLITEEDYFNDDIIHQFIGFVKKVFGEDNLEENLKYIADVLNKKSKETSRLTIRNYFVKDFYNDHVKMYKKRPIYWLIDSGKQNGIKALFYIHRYDKSTIARFRTDYLHEIQRYYENDIELTEKSNDKKKVDTLKKKLQEVTEFDKVVAYIAHQQIEFDLDDGVDHNYELFQGIEVPQGDGQKPMKADLLAKRK
jgi:type II restriction/modification system DNA methylase subunit YeeA